MCEGILDDKRVTIKRVRMYSKVDPEAATKVRYRGRYAHSFPPLTSSVDPLSRSCGVETLDAPKHRSAPRHNPHSSPACFGVDDRWGSTGIYQEKPQRKPA